MPRTLLLADDSVTIQKVVGISFANEDVQLVTVDNGDDALARARDARPDIVLADVVMPGLNGYEVCEAIKQDPALSGIPVLLLTGTFEAFDETRAQAVGADGHITKPFEAQALVDEVNARLAAAPAASAAAAPADELLGDPPATATDDAYDFFDESSDAAEAAPVETNPATTTLLLGDAHADPGAARDDDATTTLFGTDDLSTAETAPPVDASATTDPAVDAAPLEGLADGFDAVPEIEPAGGESFPAPPPRLGPDEMSEPLVSLDPPSEPVLDAEPEPFSSFSSFSDDAATDPSPDPVLDLGAEPGADANAISGDPLSLEPLGDAEPFAADAISEPLADASDPAASVLDPAGRHDYDVSSSDLGESVTHAIDAGPALADPADGDPFAGLDDDADPGPFAAPLASETELEAEPVLADPDAEPEARPTAIAAETPSIARHELHDALEKVAWEAFGDVTERIVKDAVARIEQVAWEVIPQMAESLIREEIRRLKSGEDDETS